MKDKLEQFIGENRDSFDSITPSTTESVWLKIDAERNRKSKGKIVLRYFYRAAAVLLIFGLSYMFHDFVDVKRENRLAEEKMNDIYKQLPELKEAENYYSNLVSTRLEEIKPFLADNPGISEAINVDLVELDSVYISLKNDLKDNVANDQIIEAMIQNYRLKLKILEELLAEIKQENNKEDVQAKINI